MEKNNEPEIKHIHKSYSWNCGVERKSTITIKDVTCPNCLNNLRIEQEVKLITSENYVENCTRTEPPITKELDQRLLSSVRLIHAVFGLCTEIGEFADTVKKYIFYGKPMDKINLKEELGDIHWYAGIAIDCLRTTMNEILTGNIIKLRKRFPEKFSNELAINRDTKNELNHFKE
jgi:NTP pyrophosphatase (non-canonical NTP hydrolase)